MNLLNGLRAAVLGVVGGLFQRAANVTFFPEWIRAAALDISFRVLAAEGYKGNSAAFAAVSLLARTFPDAPFVVRAGTAAGLAERPTHGARRLLKNPNPFMSEDVLMAYIITYAAVGGACYLWKQRNRLGRVIALWPLHAGQVTPVLGKGWIEGYEYQADGAGTPIPLPVEDVIMFPWAVDPLQPAVPVPPLVAVASEVDADNEAARYVRELLLNDASPRTVLTYKQGMPKGQEAAELRAQFSDRYGRGRRGGVAVVGGDVTITRMGLGLSELSFPQLRDVPETRIAAAFGTPIILLGLNTGLQRAVQGAPAEFYEIFVGLTLVPLWQRLGSVLTAGLLPEFGGDEDGALEIGPDLAAVTVLGAEQSRRWARATAAVRAGWLTPNMALAEVGKPGIGPAGDVFLRGGNVVEVGLDGTVRREAAKAGAAGETPALPAGAATK